MPHKYKRSFRKIYGSITIFMIFLLSVFSSCGDRKEKEEGRVLQDDKAAELQNNECIDVQDGETKALQDDECDDLQNDKHIVDDDEPLSPKEVLTDDVDTGVRINAATIHLRTIYRKITIHGNVKAKESANITPYTSGILHSLVVEEGESVRKDQIIAQVDPSKPGQKFLLSPVKVPFSGTISSIYIEVGNPVSINSVIAEVANNSELEVKLFVPERFVNEVRAGVRGTLTLIAFPGENFSLITKTASKVLSSVTHTMKVSLDFEKQDPRLKSGMFGRVQLVLEEIKDVPTVRIDYIVQRFRDGKIHNGVFKVIQQDGKDTVMFQSIVLGAEEGNYYQVSEGLSEGDIIAVFGQESLVEGVNVTLLELDGIPVNQSNGEVSADEDSIEENMQ